MPVNIPTPSMQWIGGMAALVSAIFAAIAVISALLIHRDTRKLLKRTERPIFSLLKPKCTHGLISGQIQVDLNFRFVNIGKNPAQDVRMRIGACLKQMPQLFKNYADTSMANRVDPQVDITWETHVGYPIIPGKKPELVKRIPLLFYILLTYKDVFDPDTEYHDEFYLEYNLGETTAGDARMENRIALKPYLEKVYGQRAT